MSPQEHLYLCLLPRPVLQSLILWLYSFAFIVIRNFTCCFKKPDPRLWVSAWCIPHGWARVSQRCAGGQSTKAVLSAWWRLCWSGSIRKCKVTVLPWRTWGGPCLFWGKEQGCLVPMAQGVRSIKAQVQRVKKTSAGVQWVAATCGQEAEPKSWTSWVLRDRGTFLSHLCGYMTWSPAVTGLLIHWLKRFNGALCFSDCRCVKGRKERDLLPLLKLHRPTSFAYQGRLTSSSTHPAEPPHTESQVRHRLYRSQGIKEIFKCKEWDRLYWLQSLLHRSD